MYSAIKRIGREFCVIVFFLIFILYSQIGYAQKLNWHTLDLKNDSVLGISLEKAYKELLKGKKSKTVIVAVIDSGIDTLHEDLKSVLWTDSRCGFHGWNYIGPETGKEDITYLINKKKYFYDSLSYSIVPEQYRKEYQSYRKVAPILSSKIAAMKNFIRQLEEYDSDEAKGLIKLAEFHLNHGLNINNSEPDTAHGNSDISPDNIGPLPSPNLAPYHGTHVAGIIAASRNNGIGINGIADNVQLMTLKVNGNIRELRDVSLAKAIGFAVEKGAKVINISMGKPYTWNKGAVDLAVKSAMQKGVLIVHAAGNDGEDLDMVDHYPSPVYLNNNGKALAWLEVGASGPIDDKSLISSFSNYGKNSVDVFAPGVKINSTIPGSKYDSWSGTSMAAPVVAGLAALIWEYYPDLSSVQVKEIIMKSVLKRDILKDKCVSGGVVNAYNALKLAAETHY